MFLSFYTALKSAGVPVTLREYLTLMEGLDADIPERRVEEEGGRFTLTRTVDVPEPVRHEALSLEEAEELLNTWKLRGPHGG